MTGTEQLRAQLEQMRKSLRAFDHPAVEEIAGLRLMHETLREREAHIAQAIQKNETCSIELVLKGGGAAGPAGAVPGVTGILDAFSDGIVAAAGERAGAVKSAARQDLRTPFVPHIAEVSADGDNVTMLLTRPPGELAAQPVDQETSAPLFEHGAVDFVEALRAASGTDGAPVSEAILPALCRLADAITGSGTVLEVTVEPFALDEVEISVNQAAAQRVALRCAQA